VFKLLYCQTKQKKPSPNNKTKQNTSGPDVFTAKFPPTLKEKLTSILLKPFHGIERKGASLISFYVCNIAL
jgi:hypothetical protein